MRVFLLLTAPIAVLFDMLAVIVLFLMLMQGRAHAHDIYTGLTSPAGHACCGGNDCEPLRDEDIRFAGPRPMIYSRRHSAWIEVSDQRTQYITIPGSKPEDAGHWCGARGNWANGNPGQMAEYNNPDPGFWTYCLFISPGGV